MKLLVETTSSFMLIDFAANQEVSAHRPSVVTKSNLVSTRIADRGLDVLAQLSDEATDAEFATYWEESEDRDLAIEAFKSAYPSEAIAPKAAPKKDPPKITAVPARKGKVTS